jgi:hypothetical protein
MKMNTTGEVRKFAAEQRIAEEEDLERRPGEKSKEFLEKGSDIYAKL